MVLSGGALVPTFSNYMLAGTNIDNYIGMLGGLAIIVTAIVHPEGVAPFFAGGMRHAGDWIVSAIPGAQTIRANYRSSRAKVVRPVLAALVVGFAVWLRKAQFIDNVYAWIAVSAAILLVVVIAFARSLGALEPSFGEAGSKWVGWAKTFGPAALVGYILGWVIWPLRNGDIYSKLWMPILGALIALFVRSIVKQLMSPRTGHGAVSNDIRPNRHDHSRGGMTWHCSKHAT